MSVNLSAPRELLSPCEVFKSHKIIVSSLSLSTHAKPSIKLARSSQATETESYLLWMCQTAEPYEKNQAKTSLEVAITPAESEMKICGHPLAGTSHCLESESKMIKQR